MTKEEILRLLKARLMDIRKSGLGDQEKQGLMRSYIAVRTRDRTLFSQDEVQAMMADIPTFLAGYRPRNRQQARGRLVKVMTTAERRAWAAKQPGGMSATIDRLIATEMAKENEQDE